MSSSRTLESGRTSESGFSMLEMSIVLVIVTFIAINFLAMQEGKQVMTHTYSTQEKLDYIKSALERYVRTFGYYPCPASGSAATTAAEFAIEKRLNGKCDITVTVPPSIFTASPIPVEDEFPDFAKVIIGTVPTRTLGLPDEYISDSWGYRMLYAVNDNLTRRDDYAASRQGYIIVNSERNELTKKAAYIVLSFGPNGAGAWPFEGSANFVNTEDTLPQAVGRLPRPKTANTSQVTALEEENHHMRTAWDRVFYKSTKAPVNESTGLRSSFDDMLIYAEKATITHPLAQTVDGKSFTPDQIPGLIAWYDAADSDSVKRTSGNQVTGWKDRISIFNNSKDNDTVAQNTPEYAATGLSGKPAILLNGTDLLSTNDEASLKPTNMTVFVAASGIGGSGRTWVAKSSLAQDAGWGFSSIDTSNNGFWINALSNATSQANISTAGTFTAWYQDDYFLLHAMRYYRECHAPTFRYSDTSLPTNNTSSLTLGALQGGVNSLNNYIGEVLIYSNPLSDYDRQRVASYLQKRWGFTNSCAPTVAACTQSALGVTCTANDNCCSLTCQSGRCCIADAYTGTTERCTKDSDCCNANSICTDYGTCWRPS